VIIIVTNIVNDSNNIMNTIAAESPHLSRLAARPAIAGRPQTINPTPTTMTRNSKIARLPRLLRDQLNQRLARNEDGATLLDWLNAAPAVKDLLARDFAGEPVSLQNLHEWRDGGFTDWQTRQDLFAAAADLTDANGEWDALAANDFTERLAAVLVVRYADALAGWNGGDDEAFRLKLRDLRRFNQDLTVLRRYNQSAARLKIQQQSFYQKEKQRTEATASPRKPSETGACAHDERVAQRRREAAAAQTLAAPVSIASAPPAFPAPSAAMVASPANAADRTAADQSVAAVAACVGVTALPQADRTGLSSGQELPTRDAANGTPASVQPSAQPEFGSNQVKPMATEFPTICGRSPTTDFPRGAVATVAPAPASAADQPVAGQGNAGKCAADGTMLVGAATLAAGLVRANLVLEFANSLSNSLKVIKEKCVNAYDLKDRRAVQSAYAGSVATVNRLVQEAGLLRAELPGFAGVDRVYAAVEMLQREYLRMKANLFQGCSATIAVGIPRLRDAACELRENLQRLSPPRSPKLGKQNQHPNESTGVDVTSARTEAFSERHSARHICSLPCNK